MLLRKAQTTATEGGRDEFRQVHSLPSSAPIRATLPQPLDVTQWTNIKNYKFIHLFSPAGRPSRQYAALNEICTHILCFLIGVASLLQS